MTKNNPIRTTNNPVRELFPVEKFDVKVHHYSAKDARKYRRTHCKYLTEVFAFPRDGGQAAYGYAQCSTNDTPIRKRGLEIALHRAFKVAKELGYV